VLPGNRQAYELGLQRGPGGDRTPDTAFSAVMAAAEAVRTNPASSEAQLLAQRDILLQINGK
jgi:hypothetical protein